jgi:hypothetical protein
MQRYTSQFGSRGRLAILLLVPVMLFGQHRGARGGSGAKTLNTQPDFKDVVVTFGGVLKNVTKKEITLSLDESHEIMTFRRTKETTFTNAGTEVKVTAIDLETHVTVDAKQDTDSKLKAMAVKAGEEAKPPAK